MQATTIHFLPFEIIYSILVLVGPFQDFNIDRAFVEQSSSIRKEQYCPSAKLFRQVCQTWRRVVDSPIAFELRFKAININLYKRDYSEWQLCSRVASSRSLLLAAVDVPPILGSSETRERMSSLISLLVKYRRRILYLGINTIAAPKRVAPIIEAVDKIANSGMLSYLDIHIVRYDAGVNPFNFPALPDISSYPVISIPNLCSLSTNSIKVLDLESFKDTLSHLDFTFSSGTVHDLVELLNGLPMLNSLQLDVSREIGLSHFGEHAQVIHLRLLHTLTIYARGSTVLINILRMCQLPTIKKLALLFSVVHRNSERNDPIRFPSLQEFSIGSPGRYPLAPLIGSIYLGNVEKLSVKGILYPDKWTRPSRAWYRGGSIVRALRPDIYSSLYLCLQSTSPDCLKTLDISLDGDGRLGIMSSYMKRMLRLTLPKVEKLTIGVKNFSHLIYFLKTVELPGLTFLSLTFRPCWCDEKIVNELESLFSSMPRKTFNKVHTFESSLSHPVTRITKLFIHSQLFVNLQNLILRDVSAPYFRILNLFESLSSSNLSNPENQSTKGREPPNLANLRTITFLTGKDQVRPLRAFEKSCESKLPYILRSRAKAGCVPLTEVELIGADWEYIIYQSTGRMKSYYRLDNRKTCSLL